VSFNPGLTTSNSSVWETPTLFFQQLDDEFNFNLDPCCTHATAKCERHFTEAEDGLARPWDGKVFMNPPYGREIIKWVEKAYLESLRGALVVCLLPARTDTRWFHEWVLEKSEIRFVRGRLKFGGERVGSGAAPFPSMVAIYRPNPQHKPPA